MTRAPSKNKAQRNELSEPLEFIALAQSRIGLPYETHCNIVNNEIHAYNGVLYACAPFNYNIIASPNTHQLLHAVKATNGTFNLKSKENGNIIIEGKNFKSIVQTLAGIDNPIQNPTKIDFKLDKSFVPFLKKLSLVVTNKAEAPIQSSILFERNCAWSTDRKIIIEGKQDIDFPRIVVPNICSEAIQKANKQLIGIGFAKSSVTFHFENGYWIKTNLCDINTWPEKSSIERIMNVKSKEEELDEDLFIGMQCVKDMSENKTLYTRNNTICSHSTDDKGAQYNITNKGKSAHKVYAIELLKEIEATHIDLEVSDGRSTFSNSIFKGVIAQVKT